MGVACARWRCAAAAPRGIGGEIAEIRHMAVGAHHVLGTKKYIFRRR